MIKSQFITDILELILDGDEDGLKAKPQMEFILESDFEYTGSGVFIGFKYANGIEKHRCENENLILDGVKIKSPELEIGADCTLFFSSGIIDHLEIWSFDGNYPNSELKEYELTQVWENSPKRKIKK